eukprot:9470821-Pyramimonas_sp.AAC.3
MVQTIRGGHFKGGLPVHPGPPHTPAAGGIRARTPPRGAPAPPASGAVSLPRPVTQFQTHLNSARDPGIGETAVGLDTDILQAGP